eukprot:gene4590-biopygen7451
MPSTDCGKTCGNRIISGAIGIGHPSAPGGGTAGAEHRGPAPRAGRHGGAASRRRGTLPSSMSASMPSRPASSTISPRIARWMLFRLRVTTASSLRKAQAAARSAARRRAAAAAAARPFAAAMTGPATPCPRGLGEDSSGTRRRTRRWTRRRTRRGLLEDSSRTPQGSIEESSRTHRESIEDPSRTPRELLENSSRTHRELIEDSSKTHRGLIEDSSRTRRGPAIALSGTRAVTRRPTHGRPAPRLLNRCSSIVSTVFIDSRYDTGPTISGSLGYDRNRNIMPQHSSP